MDAEFACGRQDAPTETSHRFETRDLAMDGLYALEIPEGAEAVERGEVTPTEMFDPTGGGHPLVHIGADPARFALGTLSIAAFAIAVLALVRWRRTRGAT